MNSLNQHIDIIFLALTPLLAPLLSALLVWFISSRYAWIISLTAPILLLIGSVSAALLFYYRWNAEPLLFNIPWFGIGDYTVMVGIYLDNNTVIMVLIVSVISFLIHLYSTGYMAGDQGFRRYFAMLGFFTFTMVGLVLAENLLLLFVFWELVGFSSYMLIGHWTDQPDVGRAARKAFMMNRIGDLGFIIALMIIFSHTGTFQLFQLHDRGFEEWQTAASLCLFLGVAGKSAQFPLLTWLPDAMAGPTPVSALIHAATMVAAGIFLLAKVFFLLTPIALNVIAITGILTALLGAAAALVHFDIKKILAYSTVSQLGLMVVAIGAGAMESSILHLFTHAFFKAGLFLAAGSVIHSLHQAQRGTNEHFDVQDIRELGGLQKLLPITFSVFIICGASLAGIPLFSGFLSKDAILSAVIEWSGPSLSWKWLITVALYVVSFLTICYTFRLIWFVFIHQGKVTEKKHLVIQETPGVMLLPMTLLMLCSFWWIVSWNPFSYSGWYQPSTTPDHTITLLSTGWILLTLGFAYHYFKRTTPGALRGSKLTTAVRQTLYLDQVYHVVFVKPVNYLASLSVTVDREWIDGLLHALTYAQVTLAHIAGWCDRFFVDGTVNGIAYMVRGVGAITGSFQGGKIQYYIFWATLGLIVIMLFLIR